MEIEKAAEIGFCTGVRRAIDILERTSRKLGPLQTLGPIVHNQQVVEKLAESGVTVAESLDQLAGDTVAISSHGVSPQVLEQAKARGIQIVDTTCPFVRRAQNAAKRLTKAGFFVIVFGDEDHREVQGVLGCAEGNAIATLDLPEFDMDKLPSRIGILSQTTQSFPAFIHFVSSFSERYIEFVSELRIINTICDATRRHQQAAMELARRVDLMLVVGSRTSANTKRLAEICSSIVETRHIETASEVAPQSLINKGIRRIGVTAGASTPDETINDVMAILEGAKRQEGSQR
jgi:4-hydroxy-3-methylbut-2-enyl diphosphate reductase